jgi:hypothetical protein
MLRKLGRKEFAEATSCEVSNPFRSLTVIRAVGRRSTRPATGAGFRVLGKKPGLSPLAWNALTPRKTSPLVRLFLLQMTEHKHNPTVLSLANGEPPPKPSLGEVLEVLHRLLSVK